MKIGILTFHWGTNYGAVLQCYALQSFLESLGHQVEVINYKPIKYDYTLRNFLLNKRFLHIKKYINSWKKERLLQQFREKYLNLSKRISNSIGIESIVKDFDVLISGSDQILNPSFLCHGEGRGKQSGAYFLDIPFRGIKIGYAVSFGCTEYPKPAFDLAIKYINNFNRIGVREKSGIVILDSMCFNREKKVVPDPTILCYKSLFKGFNIIEPCVTDYYCAYILHKQICIGFKNIVSIDEENNPLSMEDWLGTIMYSKGLITNSYHGMIVALLNKVPFVVILVESGAIGMNDRFQTLLSLLQLENRMCREGDDYLSILTQPIDWEDVGNRIRNYSQIGKSFLTF